MSIRNIFFGEKNIQSLTKIIGDELNIDDTQAAKNACRSLLVSQMDLVFKKNKEKIIRADPRKILPKLNNKSVNEVFKVYRTHMENNKMPNERRDRSERPTKTDMTRKTDTVRKFNNKNKEPRAMTYGTTDTGFAPVTSGDGEYITATGEIGKKMFFGNINEQMAMNNRLSNKEELERQILLRKAEYEGGEDIYGNMGASNPLYGYMGMGNGNNNRRPQDLNFCMDGGDTRGIANGNVENTPKAIFNPMMGMDMNQNQMGGGMMNMNMNMNPNQMGSGMANMNYPMMGGNIVDVMRNKNNNDVETRMAQMEAERNGYSMCMPDMNMNMNMNPMNMNPMNMNMNPMNMNMNMNPMMNSMMNPMISGQNNQNFHMGGRGGSSEIEELIKDKKREAASIMGLNPESLINLSPEQIDSLLSKSKHDTSSDSSSSDESESSNDKKKLYAKEMLLKRLQNKKMMNEKSHKKLGSEVSNVLTKIKNSKSATKKNKSKRSSSSESSSESDDQKGSTDSSESSSSDTKHDSSESEDAPKKKSQINNVVRVKKRGNSDVKNSVTTSYQKDSLKKHLLTIKSDEWTEPQFYNNYQVDIVPPIKNLKKILIVGQSEFPVLRPIIDDKHNIFGIIYENDTLPIELEPGDGYKITEIISGINDALKEDSIPIRIKEDNKGHIIIENTVGKTFKLDLKNNSMGPYLGFQEQEYSGKNKYLSECSHMFLDKSYYMFIKEISATDPICEVSPDGKVIQLIENIVGLPDIKTKNANVSTLTIQYRENKSIKSDLIDFYEEPHEISFELYFVEDKKNDMINKRRDLCSSSKKCK